MVIRKRLLAIYVILLLLTAGIATCSQLGVAQTSGAGTQASICSTNGTTSAKLNEYMTALTDARQFSGVVLVA